MEKIKQKQGFTMAELLIVVAIIGVLVAVSIPVFSNQLEKAREATDAANIRSAYAQVQAAALLGDSEEAFERNGTTAITYKMKNAGTKGQQVYYAVITLKQTEPDWQTGSQDIGGIELSGAVGAGYDSTNRPLAYVIYSEKQGKSFVVLNNAGYADSITADNPPSAS